MEEFIISIIENREISYGILFFFMLVYVFWKNQKLSERYEKREDDLIEDNKNLLKYNEKFVEQLKEIDDSIKRLIDIIFMNWRQRDYSDDEENGKDGRRKEFKKTDDINIIRLSPHFFLNEFESPDTREVKLAANLLYKLEDLRKKIDKPLIINSAYRTPEHNKSINGAEQSQHILGTAVDISKVDGLSVEELAEEAEKVGFNGIGLYNWGVHLDLREKSVKWDNRGGEEFNEA